MLCSHVKSSVVLLNAQFSTIVLPVICSIKTEPVKQKKVIRGRPTNHWSEMTK